MNEKVIKRCSYPWQEVPGGIGAMCRWCAGLKVYATHSMDCPWALYHGATRDGDCH